MKTKLVLISGKAKEINIQLMACLVLWIIVFGAADLLAQPIEALALPADFVRELSLPGQTDHLERPGQVFFDPYASELYVVDQGRNRVVIFDGNGTYRFDFSLEPYCGSALDLVVTSAGEIILLGSTKDGVKLMHFDFDGMFLGRIDIGAPGQNQDSLELVSLAIDSQDRLYLLDKNAPRIIRLTNTREYDTGYRIMTGFNRDAIRRSVYGSLVCIGEELCLPISNLGTVHRFDLNGELLGVLGRPGSNVGELNFPVAVSTTSDGLILILDKKRFAILSYSREGQFLGEFGGMGSNPGWFYYPSWMTVGSDDYVYISQVFRNRVQQCRVPKQIRKRL